MLDSQGDSAFGKGVFASNWLKILEMKENIQEDNSIRYWLMQKKSLIGIHVSDLCCLGQTCKGWDLKQVLKEGRKME